MQKKNCCATTDHPESREPRLQQEPRLGKGAVSIGSLSHCITEARIKHGLCKQELQGQMARIRSRSSTTCPKKPSRIIETASCLNAGLQQQHSPTVTLWIADSVQRVLLAGGSTDKGDLLLQQRVRTSLQHQRPQLSNEAAGVGGICGVLAPLTAAPDSHDPFMAVSNMVIATASPGLVYSSNGGAEVSISTSNGQRSIAGSPSTVGCNMEAVQPVAVLTTAGACRLAEAVRRNWQWCLYSKALHELGSRCLRDAQHTQHSPMAGRTAMTTRSIDPGEEAARNNGSYTGHTSGKDETHTVGSCVAICNSGGKAYSYAVLRGDEVRTHDVVVPRGGENDVQPMAHTAVMRQKAHGDVVACGFKVKEPDATGEVGGGSSGVQAVPRRAMMRTQVYASRARAQATVATEEVVVSSNRAHVQLTANLGREVHAAKCRGYHVLTRRSYRIAEHSTADRRQGEKAVPEEGSLRCQGVVVPQTLVGAVTYNHCCFDRKSGKVA
ncbi:hypothetical protein JKP88DRAFT_245969 [Tribonema minus]|uniref:Uncharacterized protein n=1 Tax=Tribonema minus TaxID=303371 RepID=A0A836CDM3_9STRA|nr:hypothetical protein JKP88DRAFT_245969 [Tribonema minus]